VTDDQQVGVVGLLDEHPAWRAPEGADPDRDVPAVPAALPEHRVDHVAPHLLEIGGQLLHQRR
jgi:hypothetical protein